MAQNPRNARSVPGTACRDRQTHESHSFSESVPRRAAYPWRVAPPKTRRQDFAMASGVNNDHRLQVQFNEPELKECKECSEFELVLY